MQTGTKRVISVKNERNLLEIVKKSVTFMSISSMGISSI